MGCLLSTLTRSTKLCCKLKDGRLIFIKSMLWYKTRYCLGFFAGVTLWYILNVVVLLLQVHMDLKTGNFCERTLLAKHVTNNEPFIRVLSDTMHNKKKILLLSILSGLTVGFIFPQDAISVGKIKQPWGNRTGDNVWLMMIPWSIPAARHGIISLQSVGETAHCTIQACSKVLFLHIITDISVKVPTRILITRASVISPR